MKNRGRIIPAIILAVGLIGMGAAIRCGMVTVKEMDRTVSVRGLSEREVKADKVTWPLIYKEIGNNPSEMYESLEQKNKQVVAFLKSGGIDEADITVNPPVVSDRQADNYSNEIMNYRYRATSVITVISTDVDKVRQLMRRQSELMKQGIAIVIEEYGNNAVVYEFTGLNEIKPEMVEEATKNARATAQKFADDSGATLGGIRSAQQGQFSIEDRDAHSPYIKRVRVVNRVEYSLE